MDFPQFGSVTLNCSFPFEENDYGASPIYIFNSSDRNTMSQVFPPLLVDGDPAWYHCGTAYQIDCAQLG